MVYATFEELKTARLHLRKLHREDVESYNRFAGSEAVTKYMLWKPHKDVAESAASIEKTLRRCAEGKCYRWGIALRETDELIGIIDLLGFDEAENTCSFAYMIGEGYWGRGYATEALTAILDFAFQKMEIAAVKADHFAENLASGTVMRKCGMEYCGCVPKKYEKNGILHDAVCYRIAREEWIYTAKPHG